LISTKLPNPINETRVSKLVFITIPFLKFWALGEETLCVCKDLCVCLYQKSVEGVYCRYIQYIRISVFVQSRRVHLFIVNCLLKNKHYKPNFHAKNIIWLKFTINYSLFKLNYNWRHCSAISLTVTMLCVCTNSVRVLYRTRLQSSATGFLMSDQHHFFSLYFYSLSETHMTVEEEDDSLEIFGE